ncbi:Alpha-aspartyl dipeptidase [Chionoecetes opilio]|uniref:Alpha-aspartyl dipeptidase n=1 Tax=Chionoecetes opilio TaxID=41210 RepID=A0A8J4XV40_CHIOP|nr:Alpha-aspartyl dipeptidase [Chionoecetes opilio]
MSPRNLLLLSNSTVHGSGYLEWAATPIKEFLASKGVRRVLFVPYALREMDDYTEKAAKTFTAWGYELSSVHKATDPRRAVSEAEAIFVGGGNTFQLLKTLYDNKLLEAIRRRVLEASLNMFEGAPYIGSSAGTTWPPSPSTPPTTCPSPTPLLLGPRPPPLQHQPPLHDANPATKHMGETREERIRQYHQLPETPPVLGLREGSLLRVQLDKVTLHGLHPARLFRPGKQAEEFPVGTDFHSSSSKTRR